MTELFVYTAVASVAALLGAIAGRVFAVEADNRLTAIFAGPYIGAGVGLLVAVALGSVLTLVAQWLSAGSATWLDALDVAGTALLWGTGGGAAGGLLISLAVVSLNIKARRR